MASEGTVKEEQVFSFIIISFKQCFHLGVLGMPITAKLCRVIRLRLF